jgi:hypothetical protein
MVIGKTHCSAEDARQGDQLDLFSLSKESPVSSFCSCCGCQCPTHRPANSTGRCWVFIQGRFAGRSYDFFIASSSIKESGAQNCGTGFQHILCRLGRALLESIQKSQKMFLASLLFGKEPLGTKCAKVAMVVSNHAERYSMAYSPVPRAKASNVCPRK